MASNEKEPLLKVEGLKQYFKMSASYTVKAVDDVSFSLYPGETYGLVGESGSGKSTIGRSLIRLYKPTAGKILFDGHEISGKLSSADNKFLRTNMQMIFQDPMACLNPRKKVGEIIGEGLDIHHLYKTRAEREEKILSILKKVGLAPEHIDRYPHQFSGGMRQRVMIAMGLSCNPEILIADEPTSALDVTIQAQILELMKDLSKKLGTAVIIITHSLGVVAGMCDTINVMYAGRVVEHAKTMELFKDTKHPYTQGLIRSVPRLDMEMKDKLYSIPGVPPNVVDLPPCCPFYPRCEKAMDICKKQYPQVTDFGKEHVCSCWLYGKEGGR